MNKPVKPICGKKAVAATRKVKLQKAPVPTEAVLKTRIEDWCDAQVIKQCFGLKDGTLKNMRKSNVIGWSKLTGRIFYYKPSFMKLLAKNAHGKIEP